MKGQTLRDHENYDFAPRRVAQALPTTWKEAIRAYIDDRAGIVKAPLFQMAQTTEWAAKDISYQCAALETIAERLTAEIKGEQKKKLSLKIPSPDKRSQLQHDVDLAMLLCPEGWRDIYAPELDKISAEAENQILQHKNIRANQALGYEVDALRRFLVTTEEAGVRARAQLDSEKRGVAPRDPRQSGAVRLVI